jgi:hypothetical protein
MWHVCLYGCIEETGKYPTVELSDMPTGCKCRLLCVTGAIDVLEEFARKGMSVKKLYATSRTTEGIKLCRDLGFQEMRLTPEDDTLRFELDLEASQSPFLRKYQQSIKRREKKPRLLIIIMGRKTPVIYAGDRSPFLVRGQGGAGPLTIYTISATM